MIQRLWSIFFRFKGYYLCMLAIVWPVSVAHGTPIHSIEQAQIHLRWLPHALQEIGFAPKNSTTTEPLVLECLAWPHFHLKRHDPFAGEMLVQGSPNAPSETLARLFDGSRVQPDPHAFLTWVDHEMRPIFTALDVHTHLDPVTHEFRAVEGDLVLAAPFAQRLGMPELAGLPLAGFAFFSPAALPLRALSNAPTQEAPAIFDTSTSEASIASGDPCTQPFGPEVDLRLIWMRDVGRLLRIPGERVSFAPSAEIQNVGQWPVPWFWAIEPPDYVTLPANNIIGPHPFLVMNAYRIVDGRIIQAGRSDVKHAWNTINVGCPCAQGQVMYVGCRDVYGVGNNGNKRYFGPRHEVNPRTGAWQSLGSHFDGQPVDNVRDHFDNPGEHGPFDHVLSVAEPVLLAPSEQWLVEAWYITANDANRYNNIGYRSVAPTLTTSDVFVFPFTDTSLKNGPALHAWVNPANPPPGARISRIETPEGDLDIAVKTSVLTNGWVRFDYALFNFDYAPGIDTFSLPFLPEHSITNAAFLDGDDNPLNDWIPTVHSNRVEWVAPPENRLEWGTLFSLSFESDAAPSETSAILTFAESSSSLNASTYAPKGFRIQEMIPANSISWHSVSGLVYQVETAASFSNPTWQPFISPITATAAVTRINLPLLETNALLRVVLPSPPPISD